MNSITQAKLAVLDAYIALMDAVVYCAKVPAMSNLGREIEPLAHSLHALMLIAYEPSIKGEQIKQKRTKALKRCKR